MKSVHKYILKLKESNVIEFPLGIQILSMETQRDNIVVYGLIDTDEKQTVLYDFRSYGTGRNINIDLKDYDFLGTAKLSNGHLKYHVFYKKISE